jgi:hypothetical protein
MRMAKSKLNIQGSIGKQRDTLNFRQISSNLSGNISYQLSANNTLSQTLSAGGFIQSGTESGAGRASTSSRLSNAMLRYTLQHKNSGLLFSASAIANQNNLRGASLWQFSPRFTMGMAFFKKKPKVSQSLVLSNGKSAQIGNLVSYRLSAAAALWGAHGLQCSYQRLQRSGPQAFFENLFTLNYSANTSFFDTNRKK